MLIAAASHSHWYTSATFLAVAGVVAVIVIGAATVWATLFVGSTKRRLTYSLTDDTPLLARTTALAPADLEVLYQGQRLDEPRVVSVRLASRGRKDIGSEDFDQGRPLTIDLGVPIVKRLASEPAPEIPESAIRVEGTRLLIGPCLIRKRQGMSFAFLVDGARPRLSHEDYLLNVDMRESAEQRVELTAVEAVLAAAVLVLGGMLAGLLATKGTQWIAVAVSAVTLLLALLTLLVARVRIPW